MNLAEKYTNVCSVCPAARVTWGVTQPHLGLWPLHIEYRHETWYVATKFNQTLFAMDEAQAEMMIVAHWLNLLKPYHMMHKDINGEFAIVKLEGLPISIHYLAHGAKPIDAIAAYLLAPEKL